MLLDLTADMLPSGIKVSCRNSGKFSLPLQQPPSKLLSIRRFRVDLGQKVSSWEAQKMGFLKAYFSLQLCSMHVQIMPITKSRRLIYADDICLAAQAPDLAWPLWSRCSMRTLQSLASATSLSKNTVSAIFKT